ncbi:hypothetical protein L218DRAFT_659224 [Marasmius fiardii PR-910]|nr:hypothetical protein L218DRAFT_659224 [Marasmius fiardii PR-910]
MDFNNQLFLAMDTYEFIPNKDRIQKFDIELSYPVSGYLVGTLVASILLSLFFCIADPYICHNCHYLGQ